jgi:signal transduction histidine kinase
MGNMMYQRLQLADIGWNIVSDTGSENPGGKISASERDNYIPIQVNEQTVGYLLAEGGTGFSQRDEIFLVNRLTRAAQTAALIAGGLSLMFSFLLAYNLMRPVRELTRAARRLGEGDLSQRVDVKGRDELASLARTFNQMADSLQNAEETRRSMTADIAHELRNPLAVQRANLEAMQDGVYPLTPEGLAPVLEQNLLLTHLVDDLRMLALVDAGELKLERTEVDFSLLVTRIVERFKPQAASHRISFELDRHLSPEPFPMVFVDPIRVEQILSNLLSNALRHTPEGGGVSVEIRNDPGHILVKVHDSGPGIAADAMPHIFERFFRADKSRSRAEGGTGLGLAIARKLAEAHSGSLTASNHPSGGALFTLTLPV